MPDFSELFEENNLKPLNYKGRTLYMIDRFPTQNGDTLVASIESAESEYRQGLCIDITGHCEMNGEIFKVGKGLRMIFWQDTAPKEITLKVFTKTDNVVIYNIWERLDHRGHEILEYWHHGAALYYEEIENGRRYFCNDCAPDDDFNDIIFTVIKKP